MNDFLSNLTVALNAALTYANWTHQDLAEAVGVARNTVTRWATGRAEMKIGYVAPVADALGVPTDLFVRPPASREEAFAAIATWRGTQRALEAERTRER